MPKLTGDHGWSYLKFRRRAQDWATVGVAAVARRSNGGVAEPAIALVSMGATPLRARARRGVGRGRGSRERSPTRAPTRRATRTAAPSTAEHLVKVLVRRAVEEASRR